MVDGLRYRPATLSFQSPFMNCRVDPAHDPIPSDINAHPAVDHKIHNTEHFLFLNVCDVGGCGSYPVLQNGIICHPQVRMKFI